MNSNTSSWARFVSDLFVPPFFSLTSFLFLAFYVEAPDFVKISVALSGLLFGFFFPIILFLYLRRKQKIINNDATVKEERTVPYLWGVFFEITAAAFLYLVYAPALSIALWLAYAGNTILLILINKFWKISAHAIGSSTAMGLLFFIFGLKGLWLLPLIILIGVSRIVLRVHTKNQVATGVLFGFVFTYVQLLCYTRIL